MSNYFETPGWNHTPEYMKSNATPDSWYRERVREWDKDIFNSNHKDNKRSDLYDFLGALSPKRDKKR